MKFLLQLFLTTTLFVLVSCGSEPSSSQTQTADNQADSTNTTAEEYSDNTEPPRSSHNCTLAGKVLDGNQLWLREKEILVAIVADSSTFDADYGDSHRVLEVYDTKNCKQLDRKILPVNESPDFPYYLAKINYNNANQLVAIKGFNNIFCFNLQNRQMLPVLSPEFKTERYGSDASAGMINRVEVWEDYLIGYAQEYGTFVFDMKNANEPKAIMPFAEYEVPEEGFSSLFLLEEGTEGVQAIMPMFDINEDEFSINPIFEKPKQISTNIPANIRNNRFLVLREQNEAKTPIALDLQKHKSLELPENIANQKTQDILKWIKAQ